ncbi:3' terminal RNA ribose 2'-O-methyltransferase Hen1 [Nocardia sp. CS682]|uniref:3' terminal RNA ribose 2'-O-methyltransferase Hen1 n=1 Tax=Nocardia sp. CS682 TaxID=1047172 RepID=UPI001075308A|nr:3' terminal RNA ribose 2'-O-methyltransferase Hen1 [Nocardia sp. CS682]QBS43627.1 3' terminal RNA ribose 2'-O-methyltransferase Hen1 [Nocardia sp. CS682]
MLLTITCTPPEDADWPATDLGFLLHKNPGRVQAFEQSYGTAHVVYPEATTARCTVALVLEIDPIRLVRGRSRGTPDFSLGQYVNDRPYAASSLLSVAIGAVFRTALHGRCTLRPELAQTALPLHVELPAVPCRGGAEVAERVFAPLGWAVTATALPLDPAFPAWGDSHYLRLELSGTVRLADALSHLYVLLPVLDGAKHYWLAADEVDKLIRAGGGWLAEHPERGWITRRYLARRQSLVRTALARLAELDEVEPELLDAVEEVDDAESVASSDLAAGGSETGFTPAQVADGEDVSADRRGGGEIAAADAADLAATVAGAHDGTVAGAIDVAVAGATDTDSAGVPDMAAAGVPDIAAAGGPDSAAARASGLAETSPGTVSLAVARRAAVRAALHEAGARRVLDLGCGEGTLLRELLSDKAFTEIVGVDVSMRALHIAERKLRLERLPERVAQRLTLLQGALTYTDARLRGYDAAVLMEVIEHVDPPRLGALEHAVFAAAAPRAVLVTTPNAEVNVRFEGLAAGAFRHADHRFEWTRAEFAAWADGVAARHGYSVRFVPIGVVDAEFGAPTQMAVFSKVEFDNAAVAVAATTEGVA